MTGDREYGEKLVKENCDILEATHFSDSLRKFRKAASELGFPDMIHKEVNQDLHMPKKPFILDA